MPSTCEPFHQSLANICLPDTNNSPQSTSFAKNCALLLPQAVYVAVSVCSARKLSHSLNSAVKHASLCLVCTVKACDVRAPVCPNGFCTCISKKPPATTFKSGNLNKGPIRWCKTVLPHKSLALTRALASNSSCMVSKKPNFMLLPSTLNDELHPITKSINGVESSKLYIKEVGQCHYPHGRP
jgi:hypothetical protein